MEKSKEEIMQNTYDNYPKKEECFSVGLKRVFFNKNLKKAIEKSEITYTQLRGKTGIDQVRISNIVNFKLNPTENQKTSLAIALNIPIDDIFPEKYNELYEKISPHTNETEAKIDLVSLSSPELLKLKDGSYFEKRINNTLDYVLLRERIAEGLIKMSPKEQKIVKMRFGMDGYHNEAMTLEEIGQEFGLGKNRIRQIVLKAINRLKENDPQLNSFEITNPKK